jgi:glycosyltransferase involved in cell wall biosynthesis
VHKESDEVVIGWTGSHSTLKYLTVIAPVLQKLESQYPGISFIIIADQLPQLKLKRMKFITWKAETEIQDLLKIDIGIMPLPDDQWTQGKCGFKALQYMALEIPAVVSDVGVNTEIIADEDSGFLCATEDEWFKSIEKLIGDKQLRKKIGLQGRKRVVEYYSVLSNSSNFLSLFK